MWVMTEQDGLLNLDHIGRVSIVGRKNASVPWEVRAWYPGGDDWIPIIRFSHEKSARQYFVDLVDLIVEREEGEQVT